MSSSLFCCLSVAPFRPRIIDHESKFKGFMQWAKQESMPTNGSSLVPDAPFAIQLVRQVNYGPQESIRYFVPMNVTTSSAWVFKEATEDDLLASNFEKVNSYKNFRCGTHNKFFEVNLYQKNATSAHHWRANLARPSRDIDLALRSANSGGSKHEEDVVPAGPSSVKSDTSFNTKNAVVVKGKGEQVKQNDKSNGSDDDDDIYYHRDSDYDYRENSPMKDFTACDKECGYCGACDY